MLSRPEGHLNSVNNMSPALSAKEVEKLAINLKNNMDIANQEEHVKGLESEEEETVENVNPSDAKKKNKKKKKSIPFHLLSYAYI